MSTYCCTQFVVSRKRLERVPDAFWSIPTARWKEFCLDLLIWGFPKIGIPQNGWFIMEIPIKMDDLGVPPFKETPICFFFFVWQVVEGKRTSVDLLLKKIRVWFGAPCISVSVPGGLSCDSEKPEWNRREVEIGVSKNRGTPKIIHFNRVFHYKPSILGYRYFWKHPNGQYLQVNGTATEGSPAPCRPFFCCMVVKKSMILDLSIYYRSWLIE